MGSQRVGHDWATELNWTEAFTSASLMSFQYLFLAWFQNQSCLLDVCTGSTTFPESVLANYCCTDYSKLRSLKQWKFASLSVGQKHGYVLTWWFWLSTSCEVAVTSSSKFSHEALGSLSSSPCKPLYMSQQRPHGLAHFLQSKWANSERASESTHDDS